MCQSGLGKPDQDLEGVELLFHQKGGSASFGTKVALSLNGVDLSCMNSIWTHLQSQVLKYHNVFSAGNRM